MLKVLIISLVLLSGFIPAFGQSLSIKTKAIIVEGLIDPGDQDHFCIAKPREGGGRYVFYFHCQKHSFGPFDDITENITRSWMHLIRGYVIADSSHVRDTLSICLFDTIHTKKVRNQFDWILPKTRHDTGVMFQRMALLLDALPFDSAVFQEVRDTVIVILQTIKGYSPNVDLDNYSLHLGYLVYDFVKQRQKVVVEIMFSDDGHTIAKNYVMDSRMLRRVRRRFRRLY